MRIEKVVGVEGDEPADQAAKGGLGLRMDSGKDAAERVRQVVGAQRQACDDPEAAATAALETPVQVRVGAGIGDPHLPIRGDDLCFEKTCGGGAELFGVAAEPAGQHQPGDADREAPATLHVATALGGDLVVRMAPDRPRPDADRRLRDCLAGASLRHEPVVRDDPVHPPRPDQRGSPARSNGRGSCGRRL
jgi:hypothetical protein